MVHVSTWPEIDVEGDVHIGDRKVILTRSDRRLARRLYRLCQQHDMGLFILGDKGEVDEEIGREASLEEVLLAETGETTLVEDILQMFELDGPQSERAHVEKVVIPTVSANCRMVISMSTLELFDTDTDDEFACRGDNPTEWPTGWAAVDAASMAQLIRLSNFIGNERFDNDKERGNWTERMWDVSVEVKLDTGHGEEQV